MDTLADGVQTDLSLRPPREHGICAATSGVTIAAFGAICIALLLGCGTGLLPRLGPLIEPALAFDGAAAPGTTSVPPNGMSHPLDQSPDDWSKAKALKALEYAADQGSPAAQWKLGQMYADGDAVPRDALRALKYFTDIAANHPDETPGTPEARFVANAFVALGRYYLLGIPNTNVRANAARAHDMFEYAATYFGDADGQYELGRLYLDGTPRDPHQAARWFQLAANKGHCRAEAILGDLLFRGQLVSRQAALGLMWLTLGWDCAGFSDAWIKALYDNAMKSASDDERQMAVVYLRERLRDVASNGH